MAGRALDHHARRQLRAASTIRSPILQQRERGAISVYAQGDDYHEIIKKRLKALARWLIAQAGGDVKVFVDTAAVMEKPLAAGAGLGWQGKHTNLVSREFGSWLFLGSIFTTLELPPDDADDDHLRHLPRLPRHLPDRAFPAPYRLDARRCISYLTIEHKGPIPRELRAADGQPHLRLRRLPRGLPVEQVRAGRPRGEARRARRRCGRRSSPSCRGSTTRTFRALFAKTAVKRTGRDRFVRNVLIAIGNSGDASLARRGRARCCDDPSPLVRGAAVWALGRLDPGGSLRWRRSAAAKPMRRCRKNGRPPWPDPISQSRHSG